MVWFRGLHGDEKKLEGSEGGSLAVILGGEYFKQRE